MSSVIGGKFTLFYTKYDFESNAVKYVLYPF